MEVLVSQVSESSNHAGVLAQQAHGISKGLDVIRNIAGQTNLLALNTAIEAARAGEGATAPKVFTELVGQSAEAVAERQRAWVALAEAV